MLFLENNCAYSPLSNIIVKIPEVMKEILLLMAEGRDREFIVRQLSSRYDENEIMRALNEIEEYNKKLNLFYVKKPYFKRAIFPHSQDEILHKLNKGLSHMIFDITWDCNFACKYCKYSGIYKGERVNERLYMRKEVIERALLFLRDHSSEASHISIGFYGGEPLLAFDNIKFAVDRAKDILRGKEIRFSLTTNGSLLKNKDIRKFLKEHNFNINVSIDGPKEIHDRYRVNKAQQPTFDNILKALCTFREEYPEYFSRKVSYIITMAPPFDLKAIMNFIESWECKTMGPIFTSVVDPYGTDFYKNFSREELSAFNAQLDTLFEESLKKDIEKGVINDFLYRFIYKDLFIYHDSPKGNLSREFLIGGFCIPGYERTFIAPDGSIYPCEKVHYHLKVGDILNGFDFDKIKRIVREVERLRNENCLDCPFARLCNICFAPIYRNEELRKDLFYKTCKSKKEDLKRMLTNYARIKEQNPEFFDNYLKQFKKGGRHV